METKKMTIDEQIELWEQRANDEFGTILKEIEKATADYFPYEEDEFGCMWTPIREDIVNYSLDGDRRHTAKRVACVLNAYDLMVEEEINLLANKMYIVAGLM